jgi:hypothetical protein
MRCTSWPAFIATPHTITARIASVTPRVADVITNANPIAPKK